MSTTVVNHASSPLLTIPEVAELLSISRVRCYQMAATGEIPSIRLSPRRIRVPQTALDAWLIERARLSTRQRLPTNATGPASKNGAGSEKGADDAAASQD